MGEFIDQDELTHAKLDNILQSLTTLKSTIGTLEEAVEELKEINTGAELALSQEEDIEKGIKELKKAKPGEYLFTGVAAISMTTKLNRDFPNATEFEVEQFEVTWSTAPTTSQNITVTLQSSRGAVHNGVKYSIDPSVYSLTSLTKIWDTPLKLIKGDELVVAYTNIDVNTVSGMLKVRPVK